MPYYMPHGACWLWDWYLIALHLSADLVTAYWYVFIPFTALWIYRVGRLNALALMFPKLWRRGMCFVAFCGLSHFGNSAEVFWGGWVYYATGLNKVAMATASTMFAREFWRQRFRIVEICKILQAAIRAGLAEVKG